LISIYLLFHLLIGLTLGLVLGHISKDRVMVPVCVILSIVSDLLDKPLAWMSPSLNSGRAIAHTLLFAVIVAVLVWRFSASRSKWMLVAAFGSIFSHQFFDKMWDNLTTWIFPAYGWFLTVPKPWGFWEFFLAEINSPIEWICGILIIVFLLDYVSNQRDHPLNKPIKEVKL